MADILISKFTTQIPRVGATPATPGFAESEGQDPVAPSGTPQVYTPVTIGSPANGLSISGSQVLTIGLASTSATGALSSTDWNTFNNKLNLTSPITGYTVGANTALADTDTILQAFGKVQGQINARISGTIASGQVAFGTGVNTVGGDSGLTWDNTNKRLTISRAAGGNLLRLTSDSTNNEIVLERTGSDAGLATFRAANFGLIQIISGANRDIQMIHGGLTSVFSGLGNLLVGTTTNAGFRLDVNGTGRVQTSLMVGSAASATNTLDVNGTARIRTISNLGSAATSVLVPSATGVVSLRTLAELASDAGLVTLTGTQTITGAKTFNNSLLVQSASNPVFRIATTDNTAIVNFRNVFNEDAAGIEMSGPSTELAIVTRVSNYNIRIQPHGTGTIKLPNVPTGTGDVLGRDSSNNLVRLGSSVVESTGTFTPTLTASGGGITYTFTTTNASYVKVGSLVYFSVTLSSISSTGSGVNELLLGSLPFNSATGTGKFWYVGITAITGSSYSKDALFDLRGIIAPNDNKVSFNGIWSTWTAPTFTSGTISISGVYSTV